MPQVRLPVRSDDRSKAASVSPERRRRRAILADLLRGSAADRRAGRHALLFEGLGESEAAALDPIRLADCGAVFRRLRKKYGWHALRQCGLLSRRGHLRYIRHRLLIPVLDPEGEVFAVLARSLDPTVRPRTLFPRGWRTWPAWARRALIDTATRIDGPAEERAAHKEKGSRPVGQLPLPF